MKKLLYILLFLPLFMQGQTLKLNNNAMTITQDGITANDTTWQITMRYRLRPLGGPAGSMSGEVSLTQKQELTYTSGSFHNIAIYPSITMTNMAESSYLDIILYRKDGDSGDATVYVKGFDIHFEIEKDGSANELPD